MIWRSAVLVTSAPLFPTKKRTLFSRLPLSEPTISASFNDVVFNRIQSLAGIVMRFRHFYFSLSKWPPPITKKKCFFCYPQSPTSGDMTSSYIDVLNDLDAHDRLAGNLSLEPKMSGHSVVKKPNCYILFQQIIHVKLSVVLQSVFSFSIVKFVYSIFLVLYIVAEKKVWYGYRQDRISRAKIVNFDEEIRVLYDSFLWLLLGKTLTAPLRNPCIYSFLATLCA